MILIYYPNKGVILNGIELSWGISRETVRQLLDNNHEEDNISVDLSKYFDSNNTLSHISSRTDTYKNYHQQQNYFCCWYDKKDSLKEIDIEYGFEIHIEKIKLNFGIYFQTAVTILKSISNDITKVSSGEYKSKKLNLVIADNDRFTDSENTEDKEDKEDTIVDSKSINNSENTLSYIYLFKDSTPDLWSK